jgi:hypothetical protein
VGADRLLFNPSGLTYHVAELKDGIGKLNSFLEEMNGFLASKPDAVRDELVKHYVTPMQVALEMANNDLSDLEDNVKNMCELTAHLMQAMRANQR